MKQLQAFFTFIYTCICFFIFLYLTSLVGLVYLVHKVNEWLLSTREEDEIDKVIVRCSYRLSRGFG